MGVAAFQYKATSEDIRPLGTHSQEEAWRMDILQGDVVDVLDKENVWRKSTVIHPENRQTYEAPIIKVGFRTYHHDGDK